MNAINLYLQGLLTAHTQYMEEWKEAVSSGKEIPSDLGFEISYDALEGEYTINTNDDEFYVAIGDDGFEIRDYEAETSVPLTKLSELKKLIKG